MNPAVADPFRSGLEFKGWGWQKTDNEEGLLFLLYVVETGKPLARFNSLEALADHVVQKTRYRTV
jgi:hypothetical protein